MKHQNIFWGAMLVFAGLLLLLNRLDLFSIDWRVLGRLWPFILVFLGISLLPLKGTHKVAAALIMIVVAIVAYVNLPVRERKAVEYNSSSDWSDDDTTAFALGQLFTEPWEDGVEQATVRLSAAAGKFSIGGTTGQLLVGESEGNHARYSYIVERDNDKANIRIKEESRNRGADNKGSELSMMLNPNPLWVFKVDLGAAEFNSDFTAFRVAKIDIDAGASNINLKIGDKHSETRININAGASSINIVIPENAGCRLTGSTVLSNRELDGFEKVSKGKYQTPDFEAATQKIYVNVDAALSNFQIRRLPL